MEFLCRAAVVSDALGVHLDVRNAGLSAVDYTQRHFPGPAVSLALIQPGSAGLPQMDAANAVAKTVVRGQLQIVCYGLLINCKQ